MTANPSARKQVRNFVLIWALITLLMGACTFVAIYTAYGLIELGIDEGVSLVASPTATLQSSEEGAVNFPTRPPTQIAPTATATTAVVATQADPPTVEPTPTPVPTIAPTLLPVSDTRFQLGIQVQVSLDSDPNIWMTEAQKLGMEWVKQQIAWELVEPQRGQYEWTRVDAGIEAAADRGQRLLVSVVAPPDWAREPGANLDRQGPPANYQDYANFVAEIVRRHPGKIHAIEIWNEQNLDREWTSVRGLVPADYVNLLRLSYQAIKAVDPGVIVISGALSPTGFDDGIGAWDDFRYMDAMIVAGLLNYTDCVGAHHNGYNIPSTYSWDEVPNDPSAIFRGPFDNPHHSWSFRSTLQGYAFRIQQAGGTQKLCVTEFGWPSIEDLGQSRPNFEFAADNTLQEQSDWTIEAINNMAEWDIVQIAIVWNLNYGALAGWDVNNDNVAYSIIGKDFNFRPVYGALQEWNREHRGVP
ncbi:MAG: hypothetical protein ACOYL5_12615 [Phototrophicaceae bacterium]|jgi:hypothetical protein